MMDQCAPPDETERWTSQDAYVRKTIFRTYAICLFTMVFCVNAPAPLFELFRRTIGLSPSELSMLYAIYAGVVIVALPLFGRASDRLGRRPLIVLGLGSIAIGSVVLAMASTFLWLVSGRMLQGVGIAAMSAPAAAALAELAELAGGQKSVSAASTVAVALAIGGASAPLFSGVAAEVFRGFPTSPLLFCAGMAVASLVSVALLPDPWRLRQQQTMSLRPQPFAVVAAIVVPLDIDPTGSPRIDHRSSRLAFWQACAAVVACFGAQTTFFTISGPIFGTLLASHVLLTAGCAMAALMIASGLGGMLARRLSAKAAIATSMGLLAPGVCGFFGLISVVPVLALMPAIAAIGISHGLGYAGALRLINETAQGARRAAYTSKFYVAIYIGGGLPVLGMGILQGWMGQAAASTVFSVVITVIAVNLLTSLLTNSKNSRRS